MVLPKTPWGSWGGLPAGPLRRDLAGVGRRSVERRSTTGAWPPKPRLAAQMCGGFCVLADVVFWGGVVFYACFIVIAAKGHVECSTFCLGHRFWCPQHFHTAPAFHRLRFSRFPAFLHMPVPGTGSMKTECPRKLGWKAAFPKCPAAQSDESGRFRHSGCRLGTIRRRLGLAERTEAANLSSY